MREMNQLGRVLLCAWSCLALAPLLLACDSDCDPIEGPVVDQDAAAGDARIDLETGAVTSFELDGKSGVVLTKGGEAVFHSETTSISPEQITLKRLRVSFEAFEIGTSEGNMELADLTVSIKAPLVVKTTGFGYIIPKGTKTYATVKVDGRESYSVAELTENVLLRMYLPPTPLLQLEGRLPVGLTLDGFWATCTQVDGELTVQTWGQTPWAQEPSTT